MDGLKSALSEEEEDSQNLFFTPFWCADPAMWAVVLPGAVLWPGS